MHIRPKLKNKPRFSASLLSSVLHVFVKTPTQITNKHNQDLDVSRYLCNKLVTGFNGIRW